MNKSIKEIVVNWITDGKQEKDITDVIKELEQREKEKVEELKKRLCIDDTFICGPRDKDKNICGNCFEIDKIFPTRRI